MVVDAKQLLEQALHFVSQDHVLKAQVVTDEGNDKDSFCVPKFVLNLGHFSEQHRVKIKELPAECGVLRLEELDDAPLEHNVDRHDQVFRLGLQRILQSGGDLAMLFEVRREHLLHKFGTENRLSLVFDFVRLGRFELVK